MRDPSTVFFKLTQA